MEFGLQITGERETALRFDQFPTFAHDRLLGAMERIEARLELAIKAAVPRKSGALLAQISGKVYDHGTRIAAVVGVRAPDQNAAVKAAALEYGSTGASLELRAHQASLDHLWSRAINPRRVDVPAYSRTPNIAAHDFLRGPAGAMQAENLAEMQAAFDAAVQDASK